MYEVDTIEKTIDGKRLMVHICDITDHNILQVSAGTTGHREERYDCLTRFTIKDLGGTVIRVRPLYPDCGPFKDEADGVEITLTGDSELDTIIDGLAFILQMLKNGRRRHQ